MADSAAAPFDPRAREVLDFWLGDGLESGWPSANLGQRWFGGKPKVDAEVARRFGDLVSRACAGELRDWESDPLSRLALVIVLDQFTRNVFRSRAEAFSGDPRARRLVLDGLDHELDAQLPWVGRVFFYMPLMHAEDSALQQRCVECFEQLHAQAPDALSEKLQGNLRFAREHREIIERFGRFPHRNAVLGRSSSAAEQEFLETGARFGQ